AMGSTAIGIIYSPWGKQSGAHINPSTTLTFFRLGKVATWDAVFYVVSQFIGGIIGALLATAVLAAWVAHPAVNYVVTMPGSAGTAAAFVAEVAITFVLMTVILHVSNNSGLHKLTGLCAGALVATYITVEAPISGMSMNPARTFASAVPAQYWTALWIYFTAPLIGMLSAAEVYLRIRGSHSVAPLTSILIITRPTLFAKACWPILDGHITRLEIFLKPERSLRRRWQMTKRITWLVSTSDWSSYGVAIRIAGGARSRADSKESK